MNISFMFILTFSQCLNLSYLLSLNCDDQIFSFFFYPFQCNSSCFDLFCYVLYGFCIIYHITSEFAYVQCSVLRVQIVHCMVSMNAKGPKAFDFVICLNFIDIEIDISISIQYHFFISAS